MSRHKRFLMVVFGLLAGLMLAGCQTTTPAAAPAPAVEAQADPEPTADPQPEANPEAVAATGSGEAGKLVIYSGRSESLVQPIIDQFAAATGIDVQVRYGDTAELAATLLEEGSNSPADLFYAQDPGRLGAVRDAGLLAPLPEALLNLAPDRFRDGNGEWIGISGRARVVVYNSEKLDEADLPATIEGFTDPGWKGRLGWAPTNGSFQAMVTAMRQVWGEDRTRAWLEGIIANEPVVYPKNTPIVEAVGAGEIDAGFVNHYYLFRFLSEQGESFPARNYFLPGGGPDSLILVSGAGILKTSQNADNARKFLEYMLSEAGQQYFTNETFEYPVVDGVETPALLTPLAQLDSRAIDIDLSDLSDLPGTARLLAELGLLQ